MAADQDSKNRGCVDQSGLRPKAPGVGQTTESASEIRRALVQGGAPEGGITSAEQEGEVASAPRSLERTQIRASAPANLDPERLSDVELATGHTGLAHEQTTLGDSAKTSIGGSPLSAATATPPPALRRSKAEAPRAPTYVPDAQAPRNEFEVAPTGHIPEAAADARIGQYEIIRKLGEGGMGVVYLARDIRLGRRVAIKVLRTQDPELTRRFIIEARTTARCTHENIVIIHEAGEHQGSPFMVLEYLEGKSLSEYLLTEPPSIPHAVEIMVGVVRALVRAHEEGIVHRDLKPDNIFITESGTVKVLDFGIAKLLTLSVMAQNPDVRHSRGARDAILSSLPHRTNATGIAGTAGYMSPEQWQTPGDVDHRADIWAVGCTLFELVTGTNPLMQCETPREVAELLASADPMPSAQSYGAKIPSSLSQIIDRCLQKERSRRYDDTRELLKDLEPFLPGRREALDGPVEFGPYAGLRAFQEEDAARFFGRSRELGTLLTRLKETPLMAAVGPSGVGKSSFLRAGVIPALKSSGSPWEVIVCRPGRTPLLALAELIRPYIQSFAADRGDSLPPTAGHEDIAERLESEPGFLGAVLRDRCRKQEGRLMLFLDQFEELYTLGAESEERRAFTRALLGAADDAVSPVRVMLSIRADFLGRTTEDEDFVGSLTKGLFFLGAPSEEGLREALVRPAEMMGYRFESSSIVREMIQFLDGTPNGLPLLQFTAAQLWEARDPQKRLLTTQSYQGMGGVSGALVSHADQIFHQLSAEQQVLCRTLFMHLVTQERTRAVRSMKELEDLAGDPLALKRLVEKLVESRLWVVTTREGDPTVEVVHESLISNWPSLQRWLEESHEDSVFLDQLMGAANQWESKNRDGGLLWRGEMVEELAHFERGYRGSLPAVAEAFSRGVHGQAQRQARVKRGLMGAGFGVLALLLCMATVGLYTVNQERHRATRNAEVAEQRLEEQIRAENERRQAEEERRKADAARQKAVKKTVVLEDKVKMSADELAAKNAALEQALDVAREQQKAAVASQRQAERSGEAARASAEEVKAANGKLQVLLDKERARAARLDAQIGSLVEDL